MSNLPYGTIAELRSFTDTTITAFEIVEGGSSGQFLYDVDVASTFDDDGPMTIVQHYGTSFRRFKRPFVGFVKPEWFGVTPTTTFADETVNMRKAVKFLIDHAGGVLQLGDKIYCGDLVWNGNNNISVQGLGTQTALRSGTGNQFAVRIEEGDPSSGCYFRDLRFYGSDDKLRHGVYLNCASSYYFDNVVFNGCGIALLSNGTIDNSFNRCTFRGNYVSVMFTTLNETENYITDVNGQTVTVSKAYFDTQPCEQTFISCQWSSSSIYIYIDYPNGIYESNLNVKIYGGAMQTTPVGIYSKSVTNLLNYALAIDSVD